MRKLATLAKVFALGATLVAGSASAVTITFGGVAPTDGSGLTSSFMDPNDLPGTNFYFIETFDQATGFAGLGETGYNDPGFDDECAVNSITGGPGDVGITPMPPSGEVNVRRGSVPNVAASPANNDTCFGYVTNNGTGTAEVEFDYTNLINLFNDTGVTYLGFYWGSVDNYNDFTFFSGGVQVGQITGDQLLSALNGSSGNQTAPSSNVYVNISFNLNEQFDKLVISTSGVAGEFDNLVVGLSQRPVPAPNGLAILALGLLALGLRSRLKK